MRRLTRRTTVALVGGALAVALLAPPVDGARATWSAGQAVYDHLMTPPTLDTGRMPVLEVPPASDASVHRFLQVEKDGKPVTWSQCHPVRYRVDMKGAPDDFDVTIIDEAIRMVAKPTGLTFEEVGFINVGEPLTEFEFDPIEFEPPLIIGWDSDPRRRKAIEDAAGVAMPRGIEDIGGRLWWTSGEIILDADYFGRFDELYGLRRRPMARSIIAHELGHILGLDHVDHAGELMYHFEEDAITPLSFGPGDLAGLRRLGQGGCPRW